MKGPDHYREAERVRMAALNTMVAGQEGFTGWQRDDLLALAQMHATLALVAATIDAAAHPSQAPPDLSAWTRVAA